MVRAVDQRAIGGAMDGASDGSGSVVPVNNRKSDRWCERWIIVLWKERCLLQAIDQRVNF